MASPLPILAAAFAIHSSGSVMKVTEARFEQPTARYLWLYVLIVWVGLNLRPSIAAVGPLLDRIQNELSVSYTTASLLTTLPFLAMGLACFQGMQLIRRWNRHRIVMGSLTLIGLASLVRLFGESFTLLALSAIAIGAGIALIQALMPALIKVTLPNTVETATGLYIGAIIGGGALASGAAPWLASMGGWRLGLAGWAILVPVALLLWYRLGSQMLTPVPRERSSKATPLSHIPRAWTLALFFGFGTAGYACVMAWLPPYYLALGWSAGDAGLLLGYVTLLQVIASVGAPFLVRFQIDRRRALYLTVGMSLIGFVGLCLKPDGVVFAVLWGTLLGLGIGALFSLSVLVPMDHHRDPARVGDLAAFVQGHGYLIAGAATLLSGMARDMLSSFTIAWVALAVLFAAMLVMSWRFDPHYYPRHID